MSDRTIGVDEKVFCIHLEEGPFQSGCDRGRWRLLALNWPHALIAIQAAARDSSPAEYTLRFECTNYPQAPPTAQPWDAGERRPTPVHSLAERNRTSTPCL